MKSRFASVLILAAILHTGAAHASIDQRQTVELDRAATVGGTVLAAGTYRVMFAPDFGSARFVKGKRTVAEAPCKVALAHVTYPADSVHYLSPDASHYQLIKIVFAQSNLAVDFPTDPGVATDTPLATEAGVQ